jgi:transcription-repair coupling factor (superfamily II helicase)
LTKETPFYTAKLDFCVIYVTIAPDQESHPVWTHAKRESLHINKKLDMPAKVEVAVPFKLDKPTQVIAGLNDSAKTFLVNSSSLFNKKVIFWLTESEEKAEELFYQLSFWKDQVSNDHSIYHFPISSEITLRVSHKNAERAASQRFVYHLKNADPGIYLIPAQMAVSRVSSEKQFEDESLKLSCGQDIARKDVLQKLVDAGYESEMKVFEPGTFASRGSIVDIFGVNHDLPIRIEWNGNTVERIFTFDPRVSKLGKSHEEISVIPVKSDRRALLTDYLPSESVVIFDNPDRLQENFDFFSMQDKEKAWDKFLKALGDRTKLFFELFPSSEYENQVKLDFQNSTLYRGNLDFFTQDIKELSEEGYQIWIRCENESALKKKLNGTPIKNLHFLTLSDEMKIFGDKVKKFTFGFIGHKEKIAFFTDKEIFGIEKVFTSGFQERTIKNPGIISEIRPGDFVVHVDHGIARFVGMQTNLIESIPKEYFVLEYAENDRLFLPVEFAEKISKYIGKENPQVHRLGSASWNQTKRTIQRRAQILAGDLLKLYALRKVATSLVYPPRPEEETQFEANFKYVLTEDQKKCVGEIMNDLESDQPMDRLLVGDVGFGKTEVAMHAALRVALNGKQVACLAPTTILAHQHLESFTKRFKGMPVKIGAVSRFSSPKEVKDTLQELAEGKIQIIIGTHRLLSQDVKFRNLGLLIIDEEQRFGVKQKDRLKRLRANLDILSLSATPIPRSLNMALAHLRDISTIQTPPPGRLPIETFIEPFSDETVIQAIQKELKRGGQIYYLHNRIETIGAVKNQLMQQTGEQNIDVAHGQLDEEQLEEKMEKFYNGTTKILVCSTIIENGIDLPSVNTLIVDRADTFGLAQLYQLRGRIGRGSAKAYAYFFYRTRKLQQDAKNRLQALLESTELGSGFQLAMRDLEIRGAGNILGAEQSGSIAAIGLSLYLRLLNQAVKELKSGKKIAPLLDVTIDLPVPAYLPEDFFESEQERLQTYQLMAQIETFEELQRFNDEIDKKHQHLPDPIKNLIELLDVKLIAQRARALNVNTQTIKTEVGDVRRVVIEFAEMMDPKNIEKVLQINNRWNFTAHQLKIDFDQLPKDWISEIKKVLNVFKAHQEARSAAAKKEETKS